MSLRGSYHLLVDEGESIGNSVGPDGRNRLHTKVSNSELEPIFIDTPSGTILPVEGDVDVLSMPDVTLADGPQKDAFGRLRTSYPVSIFDCTFQYDIQSLLWDSQLAGAGSVSHDSNKSSVALGVGTASGDLAVYQTRRYFKYHPGKSQFIAISGNLGGAKANVRHRAGQFDTNNGFYFELDGTSMYVVVRSSTTGSVVNDRIAQADWNIDKLDGTGASGITLDPSKQLILFVDYQWLGSGRIRFGTIINGELIYAHQFNYANNITTAYSRTGTLPIRVELENTGTAASATTGYLTCATIYSEGGFAPEGILRTTNNGVTARTIPGGAAAVKYPLLSLRKAAANPFIPIQLVDFSAFAFTADNLLIELTINPTLTGATFAQTVGKCEADVAATAMSGGTTVHSFYLSSTANGSSIRDAQKIFDSINVILGSSIAGVSDIVTVSAHTLSSAADVLATMTFREMT